jgi:hypothetical protein
MGEAGTTRRLGYPSDLDFGQKKFLNQPPNFAIFTNTPRACERYCCAPFPR